MKQFELLSVRKQPNVAIDIYILCKVLKCDTRTAECDVPKISIATFIKEFYDN